MGKFMNFMISVMEAREKSIKHQMKLYYNISDSEDDKLNAEAAVSATKKTSAAEKARTKG